MGSLGAFLALLGGVIAVIAGATSGNWGTAGLGIALAGIGLLSREVLTVLRPDAVGESRGRGD